MALALQADWEAIQTLYTQGRPAKELAAEFNVTIGAIQSRAARNNWRRLSSLARSSVEQSAKAAVDAVSQEVRTMLGLALRDHVGKVPMAKGWKHAAKINSELEPLVRNAKAVFGWNDSTSSPLVRINILAKSAVVSDEEKELLSAKTGPSEGAGEAPFGGGGSSSSTSSEISPSGEVPKV